MEIKIKRFDKELPLPEYKTAGAVAFDLSLRTGATIQPRETMRLPLNVAAQIPPDHFVLLAARSSLYKRGLTMRNGIGIFDEDYAGDADEYHAVLFNFTDAPVTVERGDRVAQAVVIPYVKAHIIEVDTLENPDRGGFGTTGI